MSKVTLKQIAEKLGVSVGTVDRALNNRGRINEGTKKAILELAKELNFTPNSLARSLVRNKKVNIAIIIPSPSNYFSIMEKGIYDAHNELSDFGVNINLFRTKSIDPKELEAEMIRLDMSEYDGLMLIPGGESIVKYIDSFIEQGKPVVTFGCDLKNSKRTFFVGENFYQAGRLAGELMSKFIDNSGTVALMSGFADVEVHYERINGFRDEIRENHPDIQIVGVYECSDDLNKAENLTKEILHKHKELSGIYFTSSPGTIGAGIAIEKLKLNHSPKLVGYDVSEEVRELFNKNICTAVLYQDPYMQAFVALKLLGKSILENWKPEKRYLYIKPKIVLLQNLEDYLNENAMNGNLGLFL